MPAQPYKHLRIAHAHSEVIDELLYAEPGGRLCFQHSVLSQVSMPYRSQGQYYQRRSGPWSITLKASSLIEETEDTRLLGPQNIEVPSGSRARIILIGLGSAALQQNSPEVVVSPSFSSFARKLGVGIDSRSIKSLRRQMVNLAHTIIGFFFHGENRLSIFKGPIFSELHLNLKSGENGSQQFLWPDVVRFSNDYFESLQRHAIPMRAEAVRSLQNSARDLDLLAFCSYRLRALRKPLFISWKSLANQFSDNGSQIRSFKQAFLKSVSNVVQVYPAAKIEKTRGGLKFYPSAPPVKPIAS